MQLDLNQNFVDLDKSILKNDAGKDVTLKDKLLKIMLAPEYQMLGQNIILKQYPIDQIKKIGNLIDKIAEATDTMELTHEEKNIIIEKLPAAGEIVPISSRIIKMIDG